jgi:hypothetical protein
MGRGTLVVGILFPLLYEHHNEKLMQKILSMLQEVKSRRTTQTKKAQSYWCNLIPDLCSAVMKAEAEDHFHQPAKKITSTSRRV